MNHPSSRFTRYFPRFWIGVFSLGLGLFAQLALAQSGPIALKSLRGVDVMETDPESQGTRFGPDTSSLPRDFVQQPPLVPHTIDGYFVNKDFNKCLDCHSWARAVAMKSTKISVSHFKTRDGVEMSGVSPQRYFCTQCHVPQSDARPLVGNTFEPGAGLR